MLLVFSLSVVIIKFIGSLFESFPILDNDYFLLAIYDLLLMMLCLCDLILGGMEFILESGEEDFLLLFSFLYSHYE